MANGWTLERKTRQAALIRSWQPWKRGTGPRTGEGKAVSSQNVIVGLERKARELVQARQELAEAQAKIQKLTRKRKDKWW